MNGGSRIAISVGKEGKDECRDEEGEFFKHDYLFVFVSILFGINLLEYE